jgi:spore germination cell wall hydrolase CwlJ-like protein
MFRRARAVGYAVAAFLVASSPTFANTSAEAVSLSPTYLSHTVSMIDPDAVAETVATASDQPLVTGQDAEVAVHAQAALIAETRIEDEAPRTLGELVTANMETNVSDDEHECLAGAIYFEAKGEPLEGQLAVAEVVINRAKSGRFPTTLCGVIKQPSQFSFIRRGRFPPIRRASPEWRKAVAIAHVALEDLADSRADAAMFFHARYVAPGWRGLKRVAQVGNHIFYR